MNRRPSGLKLSKAIHGFPHLRQGGGSPQPPHARRLRARLHYAHIAQIDVEKVHCRARLAGNWRLQEIHVASELAFPRRSAGLVAFARQPRPVRSCEIRPVAWSENRVYNLYEQLLRIFL